MSTHWIVEGEVDPRWPLNTRGNIGEVFPEVLTQLTYYLLVRPAEAGWRQAFDEMGILHPDDFASEEPVIIGCYGGYGYLDISYLRIVGVRAPGSSPEAIDVSLFGEADTPPYEAVKGDKSLRNSLKMLRYVMKALGTKDEPPSIEDSRKRLARWQAAQPPLDADDDTLMRYLHSCSPDFQLQFRNHMITTFTTSIITGVLADGAVAAGRPELLTDLTGAVGEVASAAYSVAMYEVAKLAKASPEVGAAFDQGVSGLGARLAAMDEAAEFNTAFDGFIERYGHRGPNDWEISSRTWENTPELAYAAIDVMRKSDHDLDPAGRLTDVEAKRTAAAEIVRPHLNFLDKPNFDKAVKSIRHWVRGREATRDLCIAFSLPTRRVFFELARRAAERGGTSNLRDVALLHPIDELPGYVADPAPYMETLAERVALRDRFAAVEPLFFISSQDEVPGIEELEAAQAERDAARAADNGVAGEGATLTGVPGCAGTARGRARVVMDPSDPAGMEPGDILVAPLTDPAWTPLFLPASAVVVNVGALMSHAVIVSRELGIPCVVAVDGATDRIQDGAMIEVDGTAGTVTVVG
ncbi:MAG: PEP-utilizing enzyme [Actinomycetota bacterium]